MLLEINNIEVVYDEVILVLRGLSLSVPEKAITTLIGSNGAGKSTTLKAISGLSTIEKGEVTRGSIKFQGERINNISASKIARMGIIQVIEGRHVFEELTVEENLIAGTYSRRRSFRLKKDIEKVYEYFNILKERKNQLAGYLSGGEQQMLAIGRALLTKPKLLLLDEPSLGLAPIVITEMFKIIKDINEEENCAILLVEQNANAALGIASYGYVLENGQIVLEGATEDLKNNKNVREFYLGINKEGAVDHYKDLKYYKRKKRWFSTEQLNEENESQ